MFKNTLIAAALIATGFAGTAIADDATASLADKALSDLQMDTVTAGEGHDNWIDIVSIDWGSNTTRNADVVSVELYIFNFEQIK